MTVFDRRLYVHRTRERAGKIGLTIEEEIVEQARQWLRRPERYGWISLATAPARGNTWLLHGLRDQFSRDSAFRLGFRTLLVPAVASADASPAALGTLQTTLTMPLRKRQSGVFGRVLDAIRAHPVLIPVASLLLLTTAIILTATLTYVGNVDVPTYQGFTNEYLPANILRSVFLFVVGLAVSVALGVVPRLFNPTRPDPQEELTEADQKKLESLGAMTEGLRAHVKNQDGIVLLVDRTHLLRPAEERFLIALAQPKTRPPELQEFFERHRVLVISVDEVPVWNGFVGGMRTVVVPEFRLPELREIARRNGGEVHKRLKGDDEKSREILEQAQRDVNALFGRSEHLLVDMALHLRNAREGSVDELAFSLDSMMVYQAVRVTAAIGQTDVIGSLITQWLKGLNEHKHLEDFGLDPPNVAELMKGFPASTLARRRDNRLLFDAARCRALLDWVRENDPLLAARAYFYWAHAAMPAVGDADFAAAREARPSLAWRQKIKSAAWLLMEIGSLPGVSVPELMATMRESARAAARSTSAATLLVASIVYAREGDTARAVGAAEEVLDWIEDDAELLDVYVLHLWELYWLTISPIVRKTLDRVREAFPSIETRQPWRIESRYDALANKRAAEPWTRGKKQLSPQLEARATLTETMRVARSSRGCTFGPALRPRPEVSLVDAPSILTTAPMALRTLAISEALDRDGDARARAMEWKASLPDLTTAPACVGDEPLQWYEHALCLQAMVRVAKKENEPFDADEAEEAFERAVLLASMLGWQGLTVELSFFLGALLAETTEPVSAHGTPPWERWEAAFRTVIDIEREAQWFLFTPEVSMTRWLVMRDAAIDLSLDDGYKTYRALEGAGVSDEVIVDVHERLQWDFNNYTDNHPEYADRAGDLYLDWADRLAAKPAAERRRRYDVLAWEQASSYSFAAQARRRAQRFDDSLALLDKASARLAESPATSPDEEEKVRAILLSIDYQRLHIHSARKQWVQTDTAAASLWSRIRINDSVYALTLLAMLRRDERSGGLQAAWPIVDGVAAPDPDAPSLSVMQTWLELSGVASIANRYEYRFWQLHQILITPDSLGPNFSQAALTMGEIGLEQTQLAAPLRPFMVMLLEVARGYYASVHYEEREIDTLRLLKLASNHSPEYEVAYRTALTEFAQLVERNRHMLAEEPLQWYVVANRIHKYFTILVDEHLALKELIRTVEGGRVSVDKVLEEQKQRREKYRDATSMFERADFAGAIVLLQSALPAVDAVWVFWEDLESLSIWMRCADKVETGVAYEMRAQQLRAFAMRYVRQLSRTVDDVQVQMIVLRLLNLLEHSLEEMARLPVARKRTAAGRTEGVPPQEAVRSESPSVLA